MVDKNPRVVEFGKKIRATRKAKNISQEKLAEMANLDRSYMGRIERGEYNITIIKMYQISDALQIDLKSLL